MTLDPEFIKQLLAKPERKTASTRSRKPKAINRDIDTWFNLNRELGSVIDGECTVEDCVSVTLTGSRKKVTVDIPISPIASIRMCRRCFLAGRGLTT